MASIITSVFGPLFLLVPSSICPKYTSKGSSIRICMYAFMSCMYMYCSKWVREDEISTRISEITSAVGEKAITVKARCQGKVRIIRQAEARPRRRRQKMNFTSCNRLTRGQKHCKSTNSSPRPLSPRPWQKCGQQSCSLFATVAQVWR